MAGLSSGLNPNVVKTALDKVFFAQHDQPPGPNTAVADTPEVFIQDNTDRAAVIMEVFKGSGLWEETAEQEAYRGDTPRVNDQITFTVAKFTKKVHISEEFLEDELHSVVRNMITDMGMMARVTRNNKAMGIFRGAASSTLTSDGVALLSASHQNINGDTVDNTISGALTETTLDEGIRLLYEQVNQAGEIVGHEAKTLLVPSALFKKAVEITDSQLRSGTGNNDLNVFSAKYNLTVMQSPYLGSNAGGSNTAWFLLSSNHSIMRFVRIPVQTKLIPGDNQENGDTVYRGRYREVFGAISYEGTVGFEG